MKYALARGLAIASTATILAAPIFPASAGERVYIPLGSAGEVVIVDTATDAVVGKFEGLPAVHGLAGTPDGRFLIAGSYQERDAGTGAPAKPSAVSEDEHAAHHGGGAVAEAADPVVSTVSVVRATDGSAVRRIDVPGAVHHVAMSPDGRVAVVTHPNAGTISAIDLTSYAVVATVPTGPLPNYAAFAPDGGRVYVSNAGNGTVSAVDATDWTVEGDVGVGASPEHVVLSADGATLYVNNVDDGTVSVIATDQGEVAKTIPVGSTLHGIDLSDDGRTLFVAAMGDDKLVAVDLITGTYRSIALAPSPYHLAAVRGAGKVYVSSADEPKVWVIDQSSLTVLGEIPISGKGHQMAQAAAGT